MPIFGPGSLITTDLRVGRGRNQVGMAIVLLAALSLGGGLLRVSTAAAAQAEGVGGADAADEGLDLWMPAAVGVGALVLLVLLLSDGRRRHPKRRLRGRRRLSPGPLRASPGPEATAARWRPTRACPRGCRRRQRRPRAAGPSAPRTRDRRQRRRAHASWSRGASSPFRWIGTRCVWAAPQRTTSACPRNGSPASTLPCVALAPAGCFMTAIAPTGPCSTTGCSSPGRTGRWGAGTGCALGPMCSGTRSVDWVSVPAQRGIGR